MGLIVTSHLAVSPVGHLIDVAVLADVRHTSEPDIRRSGLLCGACDRARVRATRWLCNDALKLWSSKPPAQKFRTFQPVSPGQLDCLGDADPQPRDDIRLARAGVQRDRGSIERQ